MLERVSGPDKMPERPSDVDGHLRLKPERYRIRGTTDTSEQCKSRFFSETEWKCASRTFPPNSRGPSHQLNPNSTHARHTSSLTGLIRFSRKDNGGGHITLIPKSLGQWHCTLRGRLSQILRTWASRDLTAVYQFWLKATTATIPMSKPYPPTSGRILFRDLPCRLAAFPWA
jgi:hypothetical protein